MHDKSFHAIQENLVERLNPDEAARSEMQESFHLQESES